MSRAREIGVLALGLSVLAVWMFQHPYWDVTHDTMLYSLLALARLHPEPLLNDVFLRFGSQDQFTVFSPVFAFMIRQFDLATAAAIMTFISQAALYGCAWFVARRFMSPASALLATGLLLALPGYYGFAHTFSYTEDFITARLPAQALALAGVAAALSERMRLATVCLLAAMLVHPIIACAAVVLVLLIFLAAPRPKLAAMVAAGLLLSGLMATALLSTGPFARFDTEWLDLLNQTTPHLFVSQWSIDDWVRLGIPMAVLLMGYLFCGDPLVRTVCCSAIVCAVAGIALNGVWSDLMHVIMPTRMQTWRWIWISSVLSVLLSPLIASENWSSGSTLRRAALIFIGASLLLRADSGAAVTLLLAVTSAALARWYPQFKYAKYNFLCAIAFLTLGAGLAVGDGLALAILPTAALFTVWRLGALSEASLLKASVLAAAAIIACLAAAPAAVRSWTRLYYTSALRATYAQWRDQLPADAQVLWPEQPVAVWYLLERPSYWSIPQTAGNVFSRSAAVELNRRIGFARDALLVSPTNSRQLLLDPDSMKRLRNWAPGTLDSLDAAGLPIICADRNLGYLVTARRVGRTSLPPITPNPDKPNRHLYIYNCKDFRGS